MTITIFSLDILQKNFDEPFVEKLLHSFKGFPTPNGYMMLKSFYIKTPLTLNEVPLLQLT